MQRKIFFSLGLLLISVCLFGQIFASAEKTPFENLYKRGFGGYTTNEAEVLSSEYYSSKPISVLQGDILYFGPCSPSQYFQLVGFSGDKAATGKVRGKELKIADIFENKMVIYSYKVPAGVNKVVFSAASSVEPVFAVSKTPITNLIFRAYWKMKGTEVADYVGESGYNEVAAGDKLYFGAVTKNSALASKVYNASGEEIGAVNEADLAQVENFGGQFSIYRYTVPAAKGISYVYIDYDSTYKAYYQCKKITAGTTTNEKSIVNSFIDSFGVAKVDQSTIDSLSGKSALFVGDSITFGARDRANIYGCGGWAGRIGYYCRMNVLNNGVSGACVSTARVSNSTDQYIYNNLIKAKGQRFDYVIMHGMFNDASDGVALGTAQGAKNFKPANADVSKFSGALENLFYTAKKMYPGSTYGYIINYKTERNVDLEPYVNAAKAICDDWGIQYLDLYDMPGFTVQLDDGLHPTSAGYDSMYTNVADWMASLK